MVKKSLTKKDLEAELCRFKDLAARAQADLQNFKIRADKEASDIRKFSTASVVLAFLPIVDNLRRAVQHVPDSLKNNEWINGVLAIEREFLRQLSNIGVQRIDALGENINPDRHEVLMQGSGAEGKVIEVVEEGYMLYDKVLRPAKVKVGCG